MEPFSGAWQRNITADPPTNLLANSTVYACVTGIAQDIAKNRIKLSQNNDGIWTEITSGPPWLAVLRKPNHYQNHIEFVEQWILSKLLAGNTYILKERDQRGVVTRLYILNPQRVQVKVADDGSIWYDLQPDNLSQLEDSVMVPATEIIHDRMPALWHPLIGVSPITACAMSATMLNKMQTNSTNLSSNASRPGGIIQVPGRITDTVAAQLKQQFESNFTGANVGRIAVLAEGMKFEPVALTAEQSQIAEQLKFSKEDICTAFHYPVWKIGGPLPPYSSGPQALTTMYYTDCLQILVEKLEKCLDEGLELPLALNYGTELDIDNLLRMDTVALFDSNTKAVGGGWMSPDEARFRANLDAVAGGDTPYLQQQNFSLAALAKRDSQTDPFASKTTPAPPAIPPVTPPEENRGLPIEHIRILLDYKIQQRLANA